MHRPLVGLSGGLPWSPAAHTRIPASGRYEPNHQPSEVNKMRWSKHGAVLLVALAASIAAEPLQAQRWGPGDRRGGGPRDADGSVERALRLRDTLQLTDDQVAQLQALRQEAVADRQAEMGRFIDARSRFGAGELTRDEFRAELDSRREEVRSRSDEREERFSAILTEEQREQLTAARRRAFRMGGRGAWPGEGRGFRDWGPPGPRRGYGPGRGWGRWMGPGADPGFRRGPFPERRPWW